MSQKEPLVISDKNQMKKWSRAMRSKGNLIALVPTMGFLHQGHLSLVAEAHKHANIVAVSIYVNPGQFSPSEDFSTYPSDFNGDINKLMSVPGGVDVVFHPYNLYDYGNYENGDKNGDLIEMGGGSCGGVVSCIEKRGLGHETWVRVEKLEKGLCGMSRPVFFRGVATVVTKLFNIVEPDVAFFGKKDYQQWRIIQRLVIDFFSEFFCLNSHVGYEWYTYTNYEWTLLFSGTYMGAYPIIFKRGYKKFVMIFLPKELDIFNENSVLLFCPHSTTFFGYVLWLFQF